MLTDVPILFSADDAAHVPLRLRHYMRHLIADPEGYEELYRRLTNQPRVVKPPLGTLRLLLPEERRQDFAPIEEPLLHKSAPSNFTDDLNGVKLEMIYIPGGEFMMGSNDNDDERPRHLVKLSPFFMGKYQITQAQ
jgi:formylglycine-generating enzyme required for sulfatase activity